MGPAAFMCCVVATFLSCCVDVVCWRDVLLCVVLLCAFCCTECLLSWFVVFVAFDLFVCFADVC